MPSRQRLSDKGKIIGRSFHHQVQVIDHLAEHRTRAKDFHLALRTGIIGFSLSAVSLAA